MPPDGTLHLLAEFADDQPLVACARSLAADGYTGLELFSPISLPGTTAILGARRSRIPAAMLLGGILGGAGAYLLQWWTVAISYPLRVGGMPLDSVPAFIPITFESTILGACLTGFVLVLVRCRLPRLWHPLFESESFRRACRDRFFVAVACPPEQGDVLHARLRALGALHIETLAEDPA